jgi:phage FluMu protein Com
MRIRCSACSALLQVNDEVAGKRIRCPRCKEPTLAIAVTPAPPTEKPRPKSSGAVRAESPSARPRPAASTASVRSRRVADVDDEDDEPTPRKKKKKKRKKDNTPMIVGIAVSTGVAVCIAITAAVLVIAKPKAPEAPMPPVVVAKQQAPVKPAVVDPNAAPRPVDQKAAKPPFDPEDDDDPPPPKGKNAPAGPATVAVIPSAFTVPEGSDDVLLARQESDRKALQRTLKDAYDKVGKRDPKWDAPARSALDLEARILADPEAAATAQVGLVAAVNKAIQARCDDPMILYLHARSLRIDDGLSAEEIVQSYVSAAEALRDSKYSAYHRLTALRTAASALRLIKTPEMQDKGRKLLVDALAAYAAAAREASADDALRIRLADEGRALQTTAQIHGDDSLVAFTRVDDALKPIAEAEGLRQKMKGDFLISYAWEARGGGVAGTVTQDGWKLFHERLREANTALEKAWSLDPKDPSTAARAITICKGLQLGEAAAKKWFDRAMSADPGSRAACEELLDFLDPKWGGSREKLVAFGRECKKSKAQRCGIPLLVAEAHARAFLFAPPGTMEAYLKSAPVWNEIAAVHDEHFAKLPDDVVAHASYGMYCSVVGKWDLASTHFQKSEGAVPASLIFGPEQFVLARQIAFRNHPPKK